MTQLATSMTESDLSRVDLFPLDSNIEGRALSAGKSLCASHAEAGTTYPCQVASIDAFITREVESAHNTNPLCRTSNMAATFFSLCI